ncbi:broad specificity phosphatase PhoE/ribonuclease HI [Streptomyces phaeochromogenes]|uniref:bifunctional RNase H/acid phosphatase n=1 Tax=Streptomyces phaeochromogenes TaxID=1923 RepID=UPI0027950E53|nr:bifunctional RNase H/acid phosphatase [Streptomyces phaeochromogenes]MDQ0952888.1 broad specificity phosphatase PhoE/ribonuclease HI [Streptomyces phaeochromogenes]
MRELIVEADGGSRGNPGPAGYGAVVIDAATGETLAEAAEYLGVTTNNVAEYSGLVAGLRAARDLDPTATVRVRMDSKLVVEQMSGRWQIKHPAMRPLAAEARSILPADQVTYEWIPRAENKHADRLANEAMDAGKRGEQWSPSGSTADLNAGGTARPAAPRKGRGELRDQPATARSETTPVSPPGVRAPLAAPATVAPLEGRGELRDQPQPPRSRTTPASTPHTNDIRAARNVASEAPAAAGGAPPDLGAPTTLVLLRHGETPLTPQKRFSGSGGSDPALSDTGRHQADRVATALAARGTVQDVISSPLARCRETAEIVAARLGLDVRIEDGLRETDFGAWEGLTFAEVRERYPDDMSTWLSSPDAEPTGGGESFEAVAHRVGAARDKLLAAHTGRTVLLVSHVTPIKTLVRLALGAPPEALFRMELSAASLSVVAYYADGNASVRLLNETSALR